MISGDEPARLRRSMIRALHPSLHHSTTPPSGLFMQRTAILNVVGLTPRLITDAMPHIRQFVERNRIARVQPGLPAVTCTAQATYLTGRLPREHGIVGNGWYDPLVQYQAYYNFTVFPGNTYGYDPFNDSVKGKSLSVYSVPPPRAKKTQLTT